MANREKFGSRLGFILVSAGCAVGLGNVWKFPYMCGQFGGAAFILIYIIFLIMLGFPIMVCEFSVGRGSQKSCATSFKVLEKKGTKWHVYGYFAMLGNYLLMMFYAMVSGWMLYYCFMSVKGDLTRVKLCVADVTAKFDAMTSSAPTMLFWTIVSIVLSFAICSLGLKNGVEKITKIMMICLLLLIVVLVFHSLTLEGAMEGVKFYLVPDFSKMAEIGIGNVIFGAMSQAFFTLSVGIGSMAIFGSYLSKERTLAGETVNIICVDSFVALMAGLIIIPACFSFGIEPGAGPSLIFITLPNIFNNMAGGYIWSVLFFVFLSFAALSTVIAVFENIISFAMDLWNFSRKKAVIINIILLTVLSIPCILGFNVLSGIQPLGPGSNIMDLEDFLVSNNLLPIGSLVYLLFCVKKSGWGWDDFIQEANTGKGIRFPAFMKGYLTYVLPFVIVIIYLKGYWDKFFESGIWYLLPWMLIAIINLLFVVWIVFSKAKNEKKKTG